MASLSAREVGRVLDQLYRAAMGVPRRFYLRSEDLRSFAGRTRSLRPEFFNEAAHELQLNSILMSFPRLGRGGLLGFVSERVAARWQMAGDQSVRDAMREQVDGDWAEAARKRLQRLLNIEARGSTNPIRITENQLCEIVRKRRFVEGWWDELLQALSYAPVAERLILFLYKDIDGNIFVITHENYVRKWFFARSVDWEQAVRRYRLDEDDDVAVSG